MPRSLTGQTPDQGGLSAPASSAREPSRPAARPDHQPPAAVFSHRLALGPSIKELERSTRTPNVMRLRLVIASVLIAVTALLAGCGSGSGTNSAPTSTSATNPATAARPHRSLAQAQHQADRAGARHAGSASRRIKTKTVLSKHRGRSLAPALPLIKGPKLDVTKKVAACFKAGHAGIVGSTMPGAYEIFNTTGPGGGGVEVAATRSAAVAREVGQTITATGHYVVIPTKIPTAVAAVANGASTGDRMLAVRCAELAG